MTALLSDEETTIGIPESVALIISFDNGILPSKGTPSLSLSFRPPSFLKTSILKMFTVQII